MLNQQFEMSSLITNSHTMRLSPLSNRLIHCSLLQRWQTVRDLNLPYRAAFSTPAFSTPAFQRPHLMQYFGQEQCPSSNWGCPPNTMLPTHQARYLPARHAAGISFQAVVWSELNMHKDLYKGRCLPLSTRVARTHLTVWHTYA